MHGFVAPTDHGWYQYFLARQPVDEVNFWRPGGGPFRALQPGGSFFFKLKAPHDGIGGFGLFARFARLPLRRDLHRLFDLGYVTVRPNLRFAVSGALHDEYENGRAYYAMDGRRIELPHDPDARPDADALAWHAETVFRG